MILEQYEWGLFLFFHAAVIHYHKPDGLKQHTLSSYSSVSQRSNTSLLGLTLRQGCFPFCRLWDIPCPYLSHLLEVAYIP